MHGRGGLGELHLEGVIALGWGCMGGWNGGGGAVPLGERGGQGFLGRHFVRLKLCNIFF